MLFVSITRINAKKRKICVNPRYPPEISVQKKNFAQSLNPHFTWLNSRCIAHLRGRGKPTR